MLSFDIKNSMKQSTSLSPLALSLYYDSISTMGENEKKVIKSESYHCSNAIVNYLTLGTYL